MNFGRRATLVLAPSSSFPRKGRSPPWPLPSACGSHATWQLPDAPPSSALRGEGVGGWGCLPGRSASHALVQDEGPRYTIPSRAQGRSPRTPSRASLTGSNQPTLTATSPGGRSSGSGTRTSGDPARSAPPGTRGDARIAVELGQRHGGLSVGDVHEQRVVRPARAPPPRTGARQGARIFAQGQRVPSRRSPPSSATSSASGSPLRGVQTACRASR